MFAPLRHVSSMGNLSHKEAADLIKMVSLFKRMFHASAHKTGFNVFENDGPEAGQHVPHAHFHMLGRASDEPVNPYKILNELKTNPIEKLELNEIQGRVAEFKNQLQTIQEADSIEGGLKFLTKRRPAEQVFKRWFDRIERINRMTIRADDHDDMMDIAYTLFPLIDSIAKHFGFTLRNYLRQLGIDEADLVVSIFRNGYAHNMGSYRLIFEDGDVHWAAASTGGSGGIMPFDPGYESKEYPEINMPAERVFDYYDEGGGVYRADLQLDRLTALVKHDLEQRQARYKRKTIDLIIGQYVPGKKRPVPTIRFEDLYND
jgi:diadenosine tetraphosphate (Ap4A) HIT family hydrolase